MNMENSGNLYKLNELDYFEVSDKDPDVRGWDVYAGDGKKIGTVEDLIVDTAALKARYLEVELDVDDGAVRGDARHILVPIGIASIEEKHDNVVINNLTIQKLRDFPPFIGQGITRAYEYSLRKIIDLDFIMTSDNTGDFYSHTHFDEDMFYANRRTNRGL